MDKLRMQTKNKADDNFKKLATMFPNAVTETIDQNGEVIRAIDKDILMQEISCAVVEGKDERYQFTWPDKKKSILLANAPISKTLRPCREESIATDGALGGFDSKNIYIEGDNLEVLKILQETYLGKIKMIYIDPPYNTGNDFVYEDDFAQSMEAYSTNSGQYDDDGKRLVQNTESNGRFHTDWLNMIYTRLRLAKDLLSDDGVIFISIDDNEVTNLKKICDEIFGEQQFIGQITLLCNPKGRSQDRYIAKCHEFIIIYSKQQLEKGALSVAKSDEDVEKDYPMYDEKLGPYRELELRNTHRDFGRFNRKNLWYPFYVSNNFEVSLEAKDGWIEVFPIWNDGFEGCWTWGREKARENIEYLTAKKVSGKIKIYRKAFAFYGDEVSLKQLKSIWTDKSFFTEKGQAAINELFKTKEKIFQAPKSVNTILQCILMAQGKDITILDFFSGSSTTAHAVMQANANDGGHRKYIMVQIPEETEEKSEAYKAGYKNICEIGKERIRKAGEKIKEETGKDIDYGFRVLKCEESNMKDVYYTPEETELTLLDNLKDNIKDDRMPEDLLFQVMLDLGVELSSSIEEIDISGKRVFCIEDGFMMACFDKNVTEEVIIAIAKQRPYYFVMRDSSMANDCVAANFDQIFITYSPDTVRKVL